MTDFQTKEMIEKLADIEHKRWADWQRYIHSRGIEDLNGEGYLCLPQGLVKNWERQIATPYADLSEAEKQSDRDQVMRYWPLILSFEQRAREDEREACAKMAEEMQHSFNTITCKAIAHALREKPLPENK